MQRLATELVVACQYASSQKKHLVKANHTFVTIGAGIQRFTEFCDWLRAHHPRYLDLFELGPGNLVRFKQAARARWSAFGAILWRGFFVNDEQTLHSRSSHSSQRNASVSHFLWTLWSLQLLTPLLCAPAIIFFVLFSSLKTPPYIPFMLLVFTFSFANHFYTYYSRTNNKRSNFLPPHHKPISFLRRIIICASVTPHRFSTTVHSTWFWWFSIRKCQFSQSQASIPVEIWVPASDWLKNGGPNCTTTTTGGPDPLGSLQRPPNPPAGVAWVLHTLDSGTAHLH